MNNDLFYIGLKGVFCFKQPYPQLCEVQLYEVLKSTSQLAILTQIGGRSQHVESLSRYNKVEGEAVVSSPDTTQTSIYNFTASTVASGSLLDTSLAFKAGAGNSNIAIFAGGGFDGSLEMSTSTSSLYNYTANTFSQGTALSSRFSGAGATSNQINAIIGGGLGLLGLLGSIDNEEIVDSTILGTTNPYSFGLIYNTCLYTYSTNTAVVSTSLTAGGIAVNAVGNSTIAIFGLGATMNQSNENTQGCIYTYANAAVSSSFYLTDNPGEGRDQTAAAGNTEQAIFVRNGRSPTVSIASIIYTYSTGSTAEGQALSQASNGSVTPGTGTSTVAIFGAGTIDSNSLYITTLYQYNYSTGQFTESQNLTFEANSDAAACNSNIGVNA